MTALPAATTCKDNRFARRQDEEEFDMTKDHRPLKPDDFPVEADNDKLKTHKGQKIAEADSEELAENIAERLNDQAHQEEHDRWSFQEARTTPRLSFLSLGSGPEHIPRSCWPGPNTGSPV
jgi:hypothetical protein